MTFDHDTQIYANDSATSSSTDTQLAQRWSPSVPWGHTYFFRRGNAIKIGHSAIPKQRQSQLQVAFPDDLEVLAVVPNSLITEPAAHAKFAHLRLRGEWFKAHPDLLSFITRIKAKAARYRDRPTPWNVKSPELRKTLSGLHSLMIRSGGDQAITGRITIMQSQLRNLDKPETRPGEHDGYRLQLARATRELQPLIAALPK